MGVDELHNMIVLCPNHHALFDLGVIAIDLINSLNIFLKYYNLVPSCGKCNQSKGNKYWRDWILSYAKLSPKTRNVKDLKEKIKRLEE